MLSHPEVAALLSERFVPLAIDNVDNPNLTRAERRFLEGKGLELCTQGMSVFTAHGKVLAMGGGYEPKGVARMLQEAIAAYRPEDGPLAPLDPPGEDDAKSVRRPPEGGLVLHTTWKVLSGLEKAESSPTTGDGAYDDVFRRALGADRLWATKDEGAELAAGRFPSGLQRRMARCHFDYVFGGPVKDLELAIESGRITGSFTTKGGDRGSLLGRIEVQEGSVRRLELVALARGRRIEDCGFAAALTVAPKGERVPVAVLFSLAEPKSELALVPPHRARDKAYLGKAGK